MHYIEEIVRGCSSSISKLVWDGSVAGLKAETDHTRRLSVEFAEDLGVIALPGVDLIEDGGKRKTFRFDPKKTSAPPLSPHSPVEGTVVDFAISESAIEDVIKSVYRKLGSERAGRAVGDRCPRPRAAGDPMMGALAAMARGSFARAAAYRYDVWLRVVGQLVVILIQVTVWKSVMAHDPQSGELDEMVTYAIISTCVSALHPFHMLRMLDERLRSGDVIIDMTRPLGYPLLFARPVAGHHGISASFYGHSHARHFSGPLPRPAARFGFARVGVRCGGSTRLDHRSGARLPRCSPLLLGSDDVGVRMVAEGASAGSLRRFRSPVVLSCGAWRGCNRAPLSISQLRSSFDLLGTSSGRVDPSHAVRGTALGHDARLGGRVVVDGIDAACRRAGGIAMSVALFLYFARLRMRERLEYRAAYVMGMVAQIVGWGGDYAVVFLVARRFGGINGWTWPELALLFSFDLFSYAMGASFAFSAMAELETMVRDGSFDAVLTRPVDPLFYLVARKYNVGHLAHVILSGSFLIWSLQRVDVHWNVGLAIYVAGALFGAACLQAAFLIAIGAQAFAAVRFGQAFQLYFAFKDVISYPLSLYPVAVQWLLTLIVPLAFVNFVPASHLLSKEIGALPSTLGWFAPLAGPLALWGSYRLFRIGVNSYQSAGG